MRNQISCRILHKYLQFALRVVFNLHHSKNEDYISKYFLLFSITSPEGNEKLGDKFFYYVGLHQMIRFKINF
jgi:hypothetical protein